MIEQTLALKKILQIKLHKHLSSNILKAVCCTAFLIFNTPGLSGIDYTWVGGDSANDMEVNDNWNPSGPPGGNDNALFTTDNNPPVLFTGDAISVANIEFLVPGVVCTIEGDLTVFNDVQNGALITSIFNIQNGGSFTLEGGSLATGGLSIYNLNASSLTADSDNESSAIINMQNGSLFTVEDVITIGSLSSASTSDSIDLQANLTFGDSSDQVINGFFSGTENLTKQGSGTVSLNGINTFNGSAAVNAGRLNVNGSILGNLTVASGATVGGIGLIGGLLTVENGGTLSPGNSIGTLTVGSLSLANASITNIEIDPNASSQIIVNGNATLGGTLHVIQDPGTYSKTGSYQIITANSITNDFSSITGGIPGFVFSLSTLANEVLLNYTLGISTNQLSGNNLKLANYLNDFAPVSSEFIALAGLSGDPLNAALSAVSPARNAFATFASQQTAFSLSDIVSGYLSNRRFIKASNIQCPEECNSDDTYLCFEDTPCHIWGGGFFQHSKQSAERQNPAFQFNSEGVIIGVDYNQSPDVILGIGLGYAHTRLSENQHAGNASVNYYSATVYGTIGCNYLYIEPAIWGIFHQIHNHRYINFSNVNETANGKLNGWQMVSHLGFGSNNSYCFGEMEAFAALDWVINWENSFREHGAGNLNMRQKSQTSSMLQSEVGLRFYEPWNYSWGILVAKESISYINRTPFDTGKVTAAITGAPTYLTLHSLTKSQNLAAVNLELFAQLGENQNYTAGIEYEGEFGSTYQSNAGTLRISIDF